MSNPHGLQTTWDAMNQALATVCPLTRSKVALIGGVTHSYKTGLLTDLFYQLCSGKSNLPTPSKNPPKVLYISLDRSNTATMDHLFALACAEHNLSQPDVDRDRDLDADDLDFLMTTLSEGGYEFELLIMHPDHSATIQNLCSCITEYITDEIEVHAVFIDGLDQIGQHPEADHVEALEVLSSFMVQHNVLCVATHQLSYAALRSKASGVTGHDLLKESYADTRWGPGGEEIAKLVDLEILLDRRQDGSTVDVLCGSHRQGVKVPTDPCLFTITLP